MNAQIPNNDFESWTDEFTPEGWLTNNFPSTWTTVSRNSTASSGSFAAKMEVANFNGGPVFPVLSITFPVNQAYTNLTGYYQFYPSIAEAILGIVVFNFKDGAYTGGGVVDIETAASVYTPFNLEITAGSEVPDSIMIQLLVVVGDGMDPGIGSYALIDQLSFGQTTDITDFNNGPSEFLVMQNYPNPFNPSTIISWQSPVSDWQTLKVYDVLGNEVATLVDEYREAGSYNAEFIAPEITSGVYFYRLKSGPFVQTRKMILVK